MLWEWENSAGRVYILDLDGTLMPTADIDNLCFWQAVATVYGTPYRVPELRGFKHVTDSGILREWCLREQGRPPREAEIRQVKQLFEQGLLSAYREQPADFSPLPGVTDWLDAVHASRTTLAGIATGGWTHSARLKLKLSGLERYGLPLASSDDAVARTDIMRVAALRTLGHAAPQNTAFVYIGDGVWDLHASRELDWGFIGIANGARATQLERAGATEIRANFCRY